MCYHADAVVNHGQASLTHLKVLNFRNYERLDLNIPSGITVFEGKNGQGKTNILEAVYYLAVLRSFRTTRLSDLHRTGNRGFYCHARLTGNLPGAGLQLSATYDATRNLSLDGKPVSSREFINQFNCVALVPEDIELTKGAPAVRRRYLNILLSQLFPEYLDSLIRYDKVLKNRNAMLRNAEHYGRNGIAAYDRLFILHGARLVRYRAEMINKLNQKLLILLPGLKGEEGDMTLQFQCGLRQHSPETFDEDALCSAFAAMLSESLTRDIERGQTRYGAHRDDVGIMFDQMNLLNFGSEGQCRLASLAMKLIAAQVLNEELGTIKPLVLLVDDVFGELDEIRRKGFFDTVFDCGQVLLTCTETPREIVNRHPRIYTVENGTVSQKEMGS